MELYSNKSIVLSFIRKATEDHSDWQLGKKALQKSLYFFNLNDNSHFSFRWANFGPMSSEVQQIVYDLEAVKRIEITPVQTKKPGAALHVLKYIQKVPSSEIPPDLNEMLNNTMKFVAERNSRDLELLASVHYWAKRSDGKDVVTYVHQMLTELKPKAKFTKTDVEKAIQELKKHRILT